MNDTLPVSTRKYDSQRVTLIPNKLLAHKEVWVGAAPAVCTTAPGAESMMREASSLVLTSMPPSSANNT